MFPLQPPFGKILHWYVDYLAYGLRGDAVSYFIGTVPATMFGYE